MTLQRCRVAATLAGLLWLTMLGQAAAASGLPVRIGGTLALSGPLAATALVHKITGEIFVEQLNRRGGLLGRPVEWVLLDDQSKPEVTRTLYEKLITVNKVDLLMGPYATGAILTAMSVAKRYDKMLVHHTFGVPHLAKYDMQFGTWAIGPEPGRTFPTTLFDALAATGKPPKTIAIVTSTFPSVHFMSLGAQEVAKQRGLREVMYLEFEFGTTDFNSIAARLRDANPDFLWMGAIGLEGNLLLDALKKLDYTPPSHFYLYPAPGPLALSPEAKYALSMTMFEEHPPFTSQATAAEFVKLYRERATKAGLPYRTAENQAGVSYAAWQVMEAAVTATKSLDDKVLAQWLRTHHVNTIIGRLRFDGPNNYGDDLSKVKQLQDGNWVVVWPKASAAPGVRLEVR